MGGGLSVEDQTDPHTKLTFFMQVEKRETFPLLPFVI